MTATQSSLDTPLKSVLGASVAKSLAAQLDLVTVGDLIYHFPRRYEERGEHSDIAALSVGEEATVLAQVHGASVRSMRNRPGAILTAIVGDDSGGILTLTFFGKSAGALAWREKELTAGRWGLFAGTVGEYQGRRQLTHPEYVLLGDEDREDSLTEYAGALIPVYPSTSALKTWQIGKCVRLALDTLGPLPDPMPGRIRGERRLMPLLEALREIHHPTSREALAIARHRLAWDEAFAVQVALVQRKRRAADWPATPRPVKADGLLSGFDAALPYELTAGQRAVGEEVAADLARPHPMHRLLQGEVGSGKTVCAVRAMLQVVDAGGQAALLAPTEVLAAQHYRGITQLLGPLGRAGELDSADTATRVALVTGSQGAAVRRRALDEVASGAAGIVVGTHALLYEGVDFADLGLVVVDEQHRFGVEQRDALRAKADRPPHVLVMTATPIPRTVAMTVFGDLDVASLTELPRGRSPIATHVVPAAEKPAYLDRAWQRLREEVAKGHQAYVVCPRIGDAAATGEDADLAVESARRPPLAVSDVEPLLREGPLHGLRIAALHGRLPPDEKDAVMRSFAAGKLDVVVATTVVEVGVDVPNATVMIILDADRFGISQLHQLRGRVGRGSAPGLCLLVSEAPPGSPARERLDAVASTLDGFRLAELDLEQRREGDVLGASQSGRRSHLRLLSLLRDAKLIGEAREEAIRLIDDDPELSDHPALAASVAKLVDEERAEYLEKG
ncbi:ATP-dependent DNA helicase RecG [Luedemannella helvata]|uniref:Probable DNA 3'-5' helicase RecG n=1 Tax=Luedemannella helvata TaxID=349315 RepID=A0ABP4WMA1_9ACTN